MAMSSDQEQERLKQYRAARSTAGLQTDQTDRNVLDSSEFQGWGGGAFTPSMQGLDSAVAGPTAAAPAAQPAMSVPSYAALAPPSMPAMGGPAASAATPVTPPASGAESGMSSFGALGGIASAMGAGDDPAQPGPVMSGTGMLRSLGRRTPPTDSMAIAQMGRKAY